MSKQLNQHGVEGVNHHLDKNNRAVLITIFLAGIQIEFKIIKKLNPFINQGTLKKILKNLEDYNLIILVKKVGSNRLEIQSYNYKIQLEEFVEIHHHYKDMEDDKKNETPNKGRLHLRELEEAIDVDDTTKKLIKIYATSNDEKEIMKEVLKLV